MITANPLTGYHETLLSIYRLMFVATPVSSQKRWNRQWEIHRTLRNGLILRRLSSIRQSRLSGIRDLVASRTDINVDNKKTCLSDITLVPFWNIVYTFRLFCKLHYSGFQFPAVATGNKHWKQKMVKDKLFRHHGYTRLSNCIDIWRLYTIWNNTNINIWNLYTLWTNNIIYIWH